MAALVVLPCPDNEGDEATETQQATDGEEGNNGKRDENRAEKQQEGRRNKKTDRGTGEREPRQGHNNRYSKENGHQTQHLAPVQRRILLRTEVQSLSFLNWLRIRHSAQTLLYAENSRVMAMKYSIAQCNALVGGRRLGESASREHL